MKIAHSKSLGEIPNLAKNLLPEEAASRAENLRLEAGILSTWQPYKEVQILSQDIYIKSIYPYDGTWYDWKDDVDFVRSVLDQDPYDRVYYTGDGPPKLFFTYSDTVEQKNLGVETPGTKPSLSKSGSTGSDPVTYTYVWCHVTKLGEEGPPCATSTIEDVTDTEDVVLSNFPSQPARGDYIEKIRIYRMQDNLTDELFFCKDLVYDDSGNVEDPDTGSDITEWTDDVAAADLGEAIPSEDYDPPPDGLHGLVAHPGGWFAGFVGNAVYMSEPWQPHAWPYSVTVPYQVVGLSVTGNTIIVLTDEYPQLLVGSFPDTVSVSEVSVPLPCLSKRSIARSHGGILFASTNGVAFGGADAGSWRLLTDEVIERSSVLDQTTWETFYPDTMHGYIHNGKYFAFYHSGVENERYIGGGFTFDINKPVQTFTRLNFYAYTAYQDYSSNYIYFVIRNSRNQNVLINWEQGDVDNNLGFLWRSGEYIFPHGQNFSAGRITAQWPKRLTEEDVKSYNQDLIDNGEVEGDLGAYLPGGMVSIGGTNLKPMPDLSGTVRLTLLEDGKAVYSKEIANDKPFRLPGGKKFFRFQYQIEAQIPVSSRELATSMAEL